MLYDSTKLHVLKETDTIIIDECSQISNELLILIVEILNRKYYVTNKSLQVVTKEGISAYMKKIKAVLKMPQPRNVKQLRSFLSLCNYYRKFKKKLQFTLRAFICPSKFLPKNFGKKRYNQ